MRFLSNIFLKLHPLSNPAATDNRYTKLRRSIFILMVLITVIPLFLMASINSFQYRKSLKREKINQMQAMVHKAEHSIHLFLQERLSTVKYITDAYSYSHLKNKDNLREIFFAMQQNFSGFIDLGLISGEGVQINYIGPYDLEGKDYSNHSSYHEVRAKGTYISDVFLGYRGIPHIVIAAKRRHPEEQQWIIRSSIDTENINSVIDAMGLSPDSDAFLLNRDGIIQTPSQLCGNVLGKCPLKMPPKRFQPAIVEGKYCNGKNILMTYVYFQHLEFVLAVVEPLTIFYKSWYAIRWQTLIVLGASLVIIISIIFRLTGIMVQRMKQADERREAAFRELEHSQKLSSIGRMAAGVAHEINNPLAIINEKTGLMKDIITPFKDFPKKEKFLGILDSVLQSVERAKSITYRLLGFARRLEPKFEKLDANSVILDVVSFFEKGALDRNININLQLDNKLAYISSDRGQLEQVLLNVLTNALAALDDGGQLDIRSWQEDGKNVVMSIEDNGCGMSSETMAHIFEPFFTTKKGYGTGLGLSITYGIIRKLGGEIKVSSKIGMGTTFYIYLPVIMKRSNGGKSQGFIG